jgi:hypothetical protein
VPIVFSAGSDWDDEYDLRHVVYAKGSTKHYAEDVAVRRMERASVTVTSIFLALARLATDWFSDGIQKIASDMGE